MIQTLRKSVALAILVLLLGTGFAGLTLAQDLSPAARPDKLVKKEPKTYTGQGIENALGLNIFINNFGFGVGGEYRRFVGPYSDISFSLDITGIRNVSEQTFQTFFGQQIVPNKYNRVLAFPVRVGFRHRFFADRVTDNFRIHLGAQVGPSLAFVYPYFNDANNSGFRENGPPFSTYEPVNDFFKGWNDGDFELGMSGKLVAAFDFGEEFERLTSVEFGFYFFYYPQGIQIMEPKQPELTSPSTYQIVDFYGKQKYFGTPQITLTFGKLW
jgi:hypothetical protein